MWCVQEFFPLEEYVKVHLHTRNGNCPFSCEVWNHFTTEGGSKQHLHAHTGQHLFSCISCRKVSTGRIPWSLIYILMPGSVCFEMMCVQNLSHIRVLWRSICTSIGAANPWHVMHVTDLSHGRGTWSFIPTLTVQFVFLCDKCEQLFRLIRSILHALIRCRN